MEKWYQVEWFKECYPLPDECGRYRTQSCEEANKMKEDYISRGYMSIITIVCYDEDTEDFVEYLY